MSEIAEIHIPFEELKSLVISCLPKKGSFEFNNICNNIGSVAVQKELVKNPNAPGYQNIYFNLNRSDKNKVRAIIWNLIIEQVLTIGDYHNDTWPHLSVTDYGSIILNSQEPIPNDPTGYLTRIKKSLCGILCKWSTVLNLKVASIFKYNTKLINNSSPFPDGHGPLLLDIHDG